MRGIIGKIKLIIKLIRVNLRTISVTLVGLIITLSMVSISLISIDSNKAQIYLSIFDSEEFEEGVEFLGHSSDLPSTSKNTYILSIQNSLEKRIEESKLGEVLIRDRYSPYCMNYKPSSNFSNQSYGITQVGIELDETVITDCIEGSSLPENENETIFVSRGELDLHVNDTFRLSYPYWNYSRQQFYNYNYSLKITGIITPTSIRNNSDLLGILPTDQFVAITDFSDYFSLINTIERELTRLTNDTIKIGSGIVFVFRLNKQRITPNNVVQVVKDLTLFLETTGLWFHIDGFELTNQGRQIWVIRSTITAYNNWLLIFLILSIPSFILTVLLVSFSMTLINEQRNKYIHLLQYRGLSSNFIALTLVLESVFVTILASIIGILAGLPFYSWITSSVGFLTFNTNTNLIDPLLTPSTGIMTFIIGVSFCLCTQIKPLLHLIRSTGEINDFNIIKQRKRKFGIFKGNFDLILLLQGLLGLILIGWIFDVFGDEIIFGSADDLFPILFTLLVLSPLFLLIGVILVFNRFIPLVIHFLKNFFWKNNWKALAFATRNLMKNLPLMTNITRIIAVAISFLMILSVLPISLIQFDSDNIYYRAGSDLVIYCSKTVEQEELSLELEKITNLSISKVLFYSDYYEESQQRVSFLGIESDFQNVAHWQNYYDDSSLNELVAALFNSETMYPVLIDASCAKKEGLQVNASYFVEGKELTVVGISSYWPGFFSRELKSHFLITSYSFLQNLTGASSGIEIWCKIMPTANQSVVTAQAWNISRSFGIEQEYFKVTAEKITLTDENNPHVAFIWTVINLNFLTSLIIIFVIIILFCVIKLTSQLSNIGLSRALGMKYHQVFSIMFIEPMLLFITSGLPGAILGLTFFYSFSRLINSLILGLSPPFLMIINFPLIFLLFCSIFLVTAVSGMVTSFLATRVNISKVLKVE
ncbi:MAG: FtsX-like permease family protein [Candidatus Thorarchaeota archaeon]